MKKIILFCLFIFTLKIYSYAQEDSISFRISNIKEIGISSVQIDYQFSGKNTNLQLTY